MDSLVYTVKERCKICYTCVRECPAKAIKIMGGQAQVMDNRCIGCGNCVKVCSQHAKLYRSSIDNVRDLLATGEKVAVILAPSFAAEFTEFTDYKILIGMLRALGFNYVNEVAFGADLVARQYKEILNTNSDIHYISSDCPAIVTHVEKYFPHLVKQLVPYVSPMVATARVLRKKFGTQLKVVFVGPCIAKKDESNEIDEVLTFTELRSMFNTSGIRMSEVKATEFDLPIGGKGAIFPISRGLLQNIEMPDSILEGNVVVAAGRANFQEALKEFDEGLIKSQNLELLCCEGCIMGAGMSVCGSHYLKKTSIRNYVESKLKNLNLEQWQMDMEIYSELDLSTYFSENDQRVLNLSEEEINRILLEMGKTKKSDHLNCGACGYDTCIDHALAIKKGLAENEMCLPYTIEKLHKYNEELIGIQQALKQSEKLAHMGQLSAGIAHELNNPLGVVIMYSNILLEECPADSQIKKDLELIVEQAARCKSIVSGLLNFARNNQVKHEYVDLVKFLDLCVKSVVIPSGIQVVRKFPDTDLQALIDKEQMIQALSNLIKNAVEAMGETGTLTVGLVDKSDKIMFTVSDSGSGIPQENMDKLFTPFFTTKAPGKGTGLGLPTTYGIVKMHKGDIQIDTNCDPKTGPTGTTFKVILPKKIMN